MRFIEFITEAATSKVFHFTSIESAIPILMNKEFKLTSSHGEESEEAFGIKGYPFYLSTTRSLLGAYHQRATSGVMFNLNGDVLNHNFKTKPIDHMSHYEEDEPYRRGEMEDRVYSKTNALKIKPGLIASVHMLVRPPTRVRSAYMRELSAAKKIMDACGMLRLPLKIYSKSSNFTSQRGELSTEQIESVFSKVEDVAPYPAIDGTLETIDHLNELCFSANPSSAAIKLLKDNDIETIRAGFATARTVNSPSYNELVEIIKFMKTNKLNTIPELIDYLKQKLKEKQK